MLLISFTVFHASVSDCRKSTVVKKRTFGLELMLRSDVGDRLGRKAGPAHARARADPTELLIFFNLALHPLAFAHGGVLAGSHASEHPAKAAFDNSVV
jgi:hypothetical protein